MRIPESELIINSDGSIFHLHIKPEQLADRVVLVGDPGRVAMIKEFFDMVRCEGASREFVWFTGTYKGVEMTVLSTGIGTDNIDIVMTELDALANIDFQTREVKPVHRTLSIVRLGTCGAIQPEIKLGDGILSRISVGFDGLMNWYEKREEITDAAMEEAFVKYMNWPQNLPRPYFVKASQKLTDLFSDATVPGVTISSPGFYAPQGRSVRCRPVIDDLVGKVEKFEYNGLKITNFEMEGSAIAGFAKHLGHEAVTVCCAIAQRHAHDANTNYKDSVRKLVVTVLEKLALI